MAATAKFNINNYIKPEPVFIENYSDLPTGVTKRVLFEVSEDTFTAYKSVVNSAPNEVKCSEEEVMSIRHSLEDTEGILNADDFFFVGDIKCEKCTRQFNYFDIFKTGEKIHGLDFLKYACLSQPKKISIAPSNKEQMIICTNCEHVWKSKSIAEIDESSITTVTDEVKGYDYYGGGLFGYGRSAPADQVKGYDYYGGGLFGYGRSAPADQVKGYDYYGGGLFGYGRSTPAV